MRKRWFLVEECSTVKKHISSLLYFKIVGNTFLATAYKLGDQKLYLLFISSDRETISQYFSQFCQTLWDTHKRLDCVGYLISFSVFYLLPFLLNEERFKKKNSIEINLILSMHIKHGSTSGKDKSREHMENTAVTPDGAAWPFPWNAQHISKRQVTIYLPQL